MGLLCIGIAGGSASGKTTFSTALVERLKGSDRTVELVSSDRFMRRTDLDAPTFHFSRSDRLEFDANHPDSLDTSALTAAIQELRASPTAPDVIVVEGHMVLHHEAVRELFDLKLFIELDADTRALRRMLRDMKGGRASTDPEFIARYYLESAKVGHERYIEPSRCHADLILRGDGDFDRLAKLVAATLTALD